MCIIHTYNIFFKFKDCFVLDTVTGGIYVWVGKKCNQKVNKYYQILICRLKFDKCLKI